ncbi:SPOSA6832_00731 [Sporobolomyces salmonicolor]|uniref:Mitochondrial import inner membrane translocase subunit Tim21 n=1 Tax=Sporidiobolus salmonicolor TaxID=5005 RepID=A0A0D6EI20_SPOSA|nr:SPOSA6832_00731 [Sporobolomyces salmonicolor]
MARPMMLRIAKQLPVKRPLSSPSIRLLATSAPPPRPPPSAHPYLSQLSSSDTSPSSSATAGPHVGPFPLPSHERDARIAASQRKWRQLGTGQKIGVAAKQGSSLVVVLAGAGLCALVFWAVGSELWSEASPTRVFEDCVERVRDDHELPTILAPPLTFHGAASTSHMRRARRISHSHSIDPQTGTETLFVRFWVEGVDPSQPVEETWLDWAKKWIGPAVWEDSHRPGAYQPKMSSEEREAEEKSEKQRIKRAEDERKRSSWGGWILSGLGGAFGGMVGGLRGAKGGEEGASTPGGGLFGRARKPKLGEHTTGEVVAELQKDPKTGHFVYKQLFVAIPDTQTPNYYRHNINTATVEPQEGKGWDRLRIWQRSKVG